MLYEPSPCLHSSGKTLLIVPAASLVQEEVIYKRVPKLGDFQPEELRLANSVPSFLSLPKTYRTNFLKL